MKNGLTFNVPFSGFCGTTFINCFSSVYMYLENLARSGTDYECKQLNGYSCDSCGNCAGGGSTPITRLEKYFFLFDTVCGRSSLRCRFDDQMTEMQKMICEYDFYDGGTDNNIDFLFGFAGFEYEKISENKKFPAAIHSSIDSGKPVIVKVKTEKNPAGGADRFRVITGYDNDTLVCPDFTNAQRRPESAPLYDEIENVFSIGNKVRPRYSFIDGLRRAEKVMEYNKNEKLWDGYTEKMGLYTNDSLQKAGIEEKKARMKRVADTMWHTFNCHNFAEVFRNCHHDDLRDPALNEMRNKIGGPCYGYTHDLAWALIGLEECADWTKHPANYYGEMIELTLSQIANNDEEALSALKEIIRILEQNSAKQN